MRRPLSPPLPPAAAVTVEVGDRVATLPATSFAGSGDVLVTGMTKGQLKKAAEQQEAE